MRPHIICHMLSSIDGKIDGTNLKGVMSDDDYEATGDLLGGDAWICGRTTMQQHFAEAGEFVPRSEAQAGPRDVFVAHRADSYAIAVDTHGKLLWIDGDLDGDHLISVVSEGAPAEYLEYLRERQISYIVSGTDSVDLPRAVALLKEHFGVQTLLLEGGGHINGAFLQAGLVDEVSLLLVPGIDGRHDIPAVFDGVSSASKSAVPLALKSVERRQGDSLWIRYDVVRS